MRGFLTVTGVTGLAAVFVLTGCVGSTTQVSSKSAALEPGEVFWAKNQLAEKTFDPAAARFIDFQVLELSNGDRVYCGEMAAVAASGAPLVAVPFYMRRSGGEVKALNWSAESAAFSTKKCTDARSGALRINTV